MMNKDFKSAFTERRTILIVDDEEINRDILAAILEDEYALLLASNGKEAFEQLNAHGDSVTLVLLDLNMPVMDGLTFLSAKKAIPSLRNIPVIVLTSESKMEVECLHAGALDFIKKPYESPEIVRARVGRIVDLFESSETIRMTSRDAKTGLFTKEYFEFYAPSHCAANEPHDMVAVQLSNYALVEEMLGRELLEKTLLSVGSFLLEECEKYNGISTSYNNDIFLFCGKHRDNYEEFVAKLRALLDELPHGQNIRFKVGVYANADGSLPVSVYANRAIDSIAPILNNHNAMLNYYDETLHENSMFQEKLVQGFRDSVNNGEFVAFFQPKYGILGSRPVLAGAEALVRWKHPEYGMISPGVFIPLFEKNGLIRRLDREIYRQAVDRLKRLKKECGVEIPISVNVSRVDIFDPELTAYIRQLVKEADVNPSLLHLEITESAYTENTADLISIVEGFRNEGYQIEMDDFGSGYSSLNMLTNLPFDYLKVDIGFIKNMLKSEKNILLVKSIVDIAKMMQTKVVAEGVEYQEQYEYLKSFGCDYIQGYYFSKPLPADDFVERVKKELAA